ncbi:Os07g0266100 [Oryza sativa Japonica Group]|uniref:Os07g0266100 protein n=1 Tax=Oryza sativa subsp. japonica TaxID=39947 RepID=A0A0P0X4J0_ORYSJ|nr:Os07g0266100 [Oryza sativa Japonica Group]
MLGLLPKLAKDTSNADETRCPFGPRPWRAPSSMDQVGGQAAFFQHGAPGESKAVVPGPPANKVSLKLKQCGEAASTPAAQTSRISGVCSRNAVIQRQQPLRQNP